MIIASSFASTKPGVHPQLLDHPPLHPQPIPNPILPLHHPQWQRAPHPKKHKRRPLPAKRIDHDTKHKPIDQLRVGEEIKGTGGGVGFQKGGHVNPFLHPKFAGAREGVDEEHEEEAGVDADMVVADGTDGVNV